MPPPPTRTQMCACGTHRGSGTVLLSPPFSHFSRAHNTFCPCVRTLTCNSPPVPLCRRVAPITTRSAGDTGAPLVLGRHPAGPRRRKHSFLHAAGLSAVSALVRHKHKHNSVLLKNRLDFPLDHAPAVPAIKWQRCWRQRRRRRWQQPRDPGVPPKGPQAGTADRCRPTIGGDNGRQLRRRRWRWRWRRKRVPRAACQGGASQRRRASRRPKPPRRPAGGRALAGAECRAQGGKSARDGRRGLCKSPGREGAGRLDGAPEEEEVGNQACDSAQEETATHAATLAASDAAAAGLLGAKKPSGSPKTDPKKMPRSTDPKKMPRSTDSSGAASSATPKAATSPSKAPSSAAGSAAKSMAKVPADDSGWNSNGHTDNILSTEWPTRRQEQAACERQPRIPSRR